MNIQKMMKQAQQMQQKMEDAQAKLGDIHVEGTAAGDKVKVVLTGKNDAVSVSIDPAVVDVDDLDMLEDLVTAAINDARKKVEEASAETMGAVTSGMQLPPGMKMPF